MYFLFLSFFLSFFLYLTPFILDRAPAKAPAAVGSKTLAGTESSARSDDPAPSPPRPSSPMVNLETPERVSWPEEEAEDNRDGQTFEIPSPWRNEGTGAGNIGAGVDENQQQQQQGQEQ